ncbi:MAG: hypothetical protein KC708_05085 [Anaerolineae bacterium]|nr:hypothetical protein [Anaerolineae bacterium]
MMRLKSSFKRFLAIFILFLLVPFVLAQDVQSDLLGRINTLRASLGRSPYSLNAALSAAAANQANWMASTREISHVQPDGSRPRDRAQAAGYGSTWVSENIYIGSDASANSAWTFWINSPVHYAGLTNTSYQDVGIASAATGDGWWAFVLVFGNPGGAPAIQSSSGGNNGGQSSAPSGPPPWVVGVDSVGNIMHEVREDDTWGDILLDYGYTWDDLPRILELNGREFTDEGTRTIKPGDVVLIPPWGGTYTPTPEAETAESQATEPADDTQSGQAMNVNNPEASEAESPTEVPSELPSSDENLGIIELSSTPTITLTPTAAPTDTSSDATNGVNDETVADTLPTATPAEVVDVAAVASPIAEITITPQPIMVRTLPARTLEPTGAAPQPTVITEVVSVPETSNDDSPPSWLVGAIVAQVGILGLASFQLMRQRRR